MIRPLVIHALHQVADPISGYQNMRAVIQHRAAGGAIESDLSKATFSACLLHVGAVHDDVIALVIDDVTYVDNLIFM